MADLKNLFVFVDGNYVSDFKTNHTGTGITASDVYYSKVAFLSGSGEIAARGELFGMPTDIKEKLGLDNATNISSSHTLMAYVTELGSQLDTLNAASNVEGSVAYQVKTAVDGLVGAAPTAYDTIYEIAAWINEYGTAMGTAASVTATLAKVPVIENALGSYTGSTYTGAYLFAHNAAVEEATAMRNSLNNSDSVVTGQYVSSVSLNNGTWTITRESLPQLSVASTSTNYVGVSDHQIELYTSSISPTTGFVYNDPNTQNNETTSTYSTNSAETIGNGLVTASVVYDRLRADETFVASALSTIDARITTVVSVATGDLDSTILISDSNSYVTAYVVEEDGKLKGSTSYLTFDYAKIYDQLDSTLTITATENSTTYGSATIAIADGKLTSTGSSLTINKTNLLAKSEASIVSATSGTDSNAYIEVTVVTENHDVKSVIVDFDPWGEYVPSSQQP